MTPAQRNKTIVRIIVERLRGLRERGIDNLGSDGPYVYRENPVIDETNLNRLGKYFAGVLDLEDAALGLELDAYKDFKNRTWASLTEAEKKALAKYQPKIFKRLRTAHLKKAKGG